MEKLPGDNYIFIKDKLHENDTAVLDSEIGKISKELTTITNKQFGFWGDEKRLFLIEYLMKEDMRLRKAQIPKDVQGQRDSSKY